MDLGFIQNKQDIFFHNSHGYDQSACGRKNRLFLDEKAIVLSIQGYSDSLILCQKDFYRQFTPKRYNRGEFLRSLRPDASLAPAVPVYTNAS